MNIWKFLLYIIKRCKFWFIASSVLALLPSSLSAYSHVYYAKILNFITQNIHSVFAPEIMFSFGILAALYFAEDIINGIRIFVDARMKIRYQRIMYNTLFAHNHKHSANFYNTEQTGVVLSKTENLEMHMFTLFSTIRHDALPQIAFVVTIAVLLCRISLLFSFILISLNIIETIVTYTLYQKMKAYAKTSAKHGSITIGYVVDSIANARLVKSTAAIYHEKLTLRKKINTFIRSKITESKIAGLSNMQNTLVFVLFTILNMMTVTIFYNYQNLSTENVILAITLLIRLADHSFNTARIFDKLQVTLGIINDALEFLYRPFEITDAPHAKNLKIKQNSVEFKNATFSYKKDKTLFNKLNLTITPNEKLGLVGISGSGKSTLINLVLRAFDLQSGKILISGQDIAKVTQYSLHQNIALISQEPCLFNRSIMENIRFAKPKATDEEVYKAAKLAHIHDVILKMPKGYNSVVGERGVKLSGGERQRIAIAAAILKDTPILILDEATSALDSQSEQAIEKALKNIMKNKTVIAIAHRLSTLKNMDKIAVLDKGKIIEYGSQNELLKNKSGTFYKLYKLQSDGYLQE